MIYDTFTQEQQKIIAELEKLSGVAYELGTLGRPIEPEIASCIRAARILITKARVDIYYQLEEAYIDEKG